MIVGQTRPPPHYTALVSEDIRSGFRPMQYPLIVGWSETDSALRIRKRSLPNKNLLLGKFLLAFHQCKDQVFHNPCDLCGLSL